MQLLYLMLVQQQLPRPKRVFVEYIALLIWAYMHADKQHLAIFYLGIAILKAHLAGAHAFTSVPTRAMPHS